MVYILLSAKRRAYFCKSIAIEMGGLSRYFSKVSGSGVDVTLLNNTSRFMGSKVPEGHHPRGTTLREALRGNLPLRGLCEGLSEGSARSLRGLCGALRGSAGLSEGFQRW